MPHVVPLPGARYGATRVPVARLKAQLARSVRRIGRYPKDRPTRALADTARGGPLLPGSDCAPLTRPGPLDAIHRAQAGPPKNQHPALTQGVAACLQIEGRRSCKRHPTAFAILRPPMLASPKVPLLRLRAAGATNIGQRKLNEDCYVLRDDLGLYVVADGAGGHNGGEVASSMAVHSITNYFEATLAEGRDQMELDRFGLSIPARRLSAAVHKANRDVTEISQSHREHRGMGTTVIATHFSPYAGLVHVANVGDSRCYRCREGQLEQLTQDHNLLTDVMEVRPDLDDYQLARLPRSVITRALGVSVELRVSMRSFGVVTGDRYLLCSDGLTGPLASSVIAECLCSDGTVQEVADRLVLGAVNGGGKDNVTAVVIECYAGPELALPPPLTQVDREADPELLIMGVEEIDLNDDSVEGLREALGPMLDRDRGRS